MMMDIPLVDTHVHLWDPNRLTYAWLENLPALNRPFLLPQYYQATDGVPIARMVFLQCDCQASENRQEVAMITELAAIEPRLQGIVAFAPLEDGQAVRDELAALAANSLVKGIRRLTQGEADPDFCNRPGFVAGVKLLPDFGFTCDLCISYVQLANTIELVRACPEVTFILDHLGKPGIRDGLAEPWRSQLRELASLPNAYCKLSGVMNEANQETWTYDDIAPYMQHALDCFGPQRLMFGSDWPVVNLSASYRQWVEVVGRFLAPLSDAQQRQILHDNAIAFYRLA